MITIDVGKIINNVVSAVVLLLVIGAVKIIWDGATTVSEKVDAATAGLKVVVEEVQVALIDLQEQNNELAEQNNSMATALNELKSQLRGMDVSLDSISLPEGHPPIKKFIPRTVKESNFLEQKMAPYEQMSR